MRVDDEVYVKAIAGARTVPHRGGAVIVVVTVDDNTIAIIAMNYLVGNCQKWQMSFANPKFPGEIAPQHDKRF